MEVSPCYDCRDEASDDLMHKALYRNCNGFCWLLYEIRHLQSMWKRKTCDLYAYNFKCRKQLLIWPQPIKMVMGYLKIDMVMHNQILHVEIISYVHVILYKSPQRQNGQISILSLYYILSVDFRSWWTRSGVKVEVALCSIVHERYVSFIGVSRAEARSR